MKEGEIKAVDTWAVWEVDGQKVFYQTYITPENIYEMMDETANAVLMGGAVAPQLTLKSGKKILVDDMWFMQVNARED